MTKAENDALIVLITKVDGLILSHNDLRVDVRKAWDCQTADEKAIAVLIEAHGTLKERVNAWSLLNSLGIVIVAIAAAVVAILQR